MSFWSAVYSALIEIRTQLFRSMLTLLSIMLGVGSLLAMSALVRGMEKGMAEALLSFGGMERVMLASRSVLPVSQRHRTDQMEGLTLLDVQALQLGAPLLSEITPRISMWDDPGFGRRPAVTRKGKWANPYGFLGTWPSALEVMGHEMGEGRMFSALDDELARFVCVIGTGIRDSLFGTPETVGRQINPVGETLQINGVPFRIVGMFKHYQSASTTSDIFNGKNRAIYLPLKTLLLKLRSGSGTNGHPVTRLSAIDFKVPSMALLEPAIQQARNILSQTHRGLDDFAFQTKLERADEMERFIRSARISGAVIAVIALLVGGIGITNIMLASLSERIREIGVRKALGASSFAVFSQFLIEGVVLAMLGGLLGFGFLAGLGGAHHYPGSPR